jgi:hypothetical protein
LPQSEIERNQKNHASYMERINQIKASHPDALNMLRSSAISQPMVTTINTVKAKTFKKRKR